MAFGQNIDLLFDSWGVAPGYGENGLRPKKASLTDPLQRDEGEM